MKAFQPQYKKVTLSQHPTVSSMRVRLAYNNCCNYGSKSGLRLLQ